MSMLKSNAAGGKHKKTYRLSITENTWAAELEPLANESVRSSPNSGAGVFGLHDARAATTSGAEKGRSTGRGILHGRSTLLLWPARASGGQSKHVAGSLVYLQNWANNPVTPAGMYKFRDFLKLEVHIHVF